MAKTLIFIEYAKEVEAIKDYVLDDIIIIALLPSAGVELSRRGIPFENTISLFGFDGHSETLKKSKLIVEGIRPLLTLLSDNNVQHAFEKTWIVYFRIPLNYWLSMLFIIDRAVKFHKPSKFIIIRSKHINNNSLSKVIENYAASNGIKTEYSNKVILNNSSLKSNSPIIRYLTKLIFGFQLRLFSIIRNNRNTFLLLSDANNMPRLVNRLSKHFFNNFPVYLTVHKKNFKKRIIEMLKGRTFSFLFIPKYTPNNFKVNFQGRYDDCSTEINQYLRKSNLDVEFCGVDLTNFIMTFNDNNLRERMMDLYGEIISINRVLEVVNPKSVFAQHSLGIGYALGELCYNKKIPGLLITHGSHTPQEEPLPSYEWSLHAHQIFNGMYPFVSIQTPWAKNFLKKQDVVFSKLIETGPLIFAESVKNEQSNSKIRFRLFGQSQAQKRIILHAGSPRAWSAFRPWVYETVDEYINNINTTIKAVEKFSDLYLCIRFRPQENLSLKEFKMSLLESNCYGVYSEGPFDEFLASSDLLISYSSTTIEEALQHQLPVLQYDPDGKYQHIHGEFFSKDGVNSFSTVYSVLDENHLLPALEWWKENHSDDINRKLDWTEHVFENKEDMQWLEIMDIKC